MTGEEEQKLVRVTPSLLETRPKDWPTCGMCISWENSDDSEESCKDGFMADPMDDAKGAECYWPKDPEMTLAEARAIYVHPNGHSKEELHECLRIMNAHASTQPTGFGKMQVLALLDAKRRLDGCTEEERWP